MTTTIKIQAPVKLRPGPWTTTATPVSMTLPLPVSSTWRIYAVTIHLEYQGGLPGVVSPVKPAVARVAGVRRTAAQPELPAPDTSQRDRDSLHRSPAGSAPAQQGLPDAVDRPAAHPGRGPAVRRCGHARPVTPGGGTVVIAATALAPLTAGLLVQQVSGAWAVGAFRRHDGHSRPAVPGPCRACGRRRAILDLACLADVPESQVTLNGGCLLTASERR
jgi:hypothetical protein